VKKTKAWNSGQLTGLERCQADLEDDLEASILTSYETIYNQFEEYPGRRFF
jgi:hypothetical protein